MVEQHDTSIDWAKRVLDAESLAEAAIAADDTAGFEAAMDARAWAERKMREVER